MNKMEKHNCEMVTLLVGNMKFTCSRDILISHSAYFCTLLRPNHNGFIESKQSEITLQEVDPKAFGVIWKTISGGPGILLSEDFSLSVFQTSAMLQFEAVFNWCVEFATANLDIGNCLNYMTCAEQLGAKELFIRAQFLAMWEYIPIRHTPAFYALKVDDVENYLGSNMLQTYNENMVLMSLISWVYNDCGKRKPSMERLLSCVRWNYVPADIITNLASHFFEGRALCIINCITSLKSSVHQDLIELPYEGTQCEEFMAIAKHLLALPQRMTPRFPCFIGNRLMNGEKSDTGESPNKLPSVGLFDPTKSQLDVIVDMDKLSGHLEYTGYSVISVGKNVYVLGGEQNLGHGCWNDNIWRYDMLAKEWKAVSLLPSPRRHASVCATKDQIFLLGGIGKHRIILDTCISYTISKDIWEKHTPMPQKLNSAACCIHNRQIFVVGSQVHSYSPVSKNWDTLTNIEFPSNMGCHNAFSYGKHIYLTGKYTRQLIRFDPEEAKQKTHTQVECIGNFSKKTQKSCIVNDHIYVFNSEEKVLHVEMYDLKKEEFAVVWNCSNKIVHPFNEVGFADFMPDQFGGCFSIVKCWSTNS